MSNQSGANFRFMKKRLLIFTVMLTAFLMAAFAGNESNTLIINQKSGGQIVLALEKKPVITFQGETLIITATGSSSYSISMADVQSYTFDDTSTGIASLKEDGNLPVIQNGHVIFQKMTQGQSVDVYSADGKMVSSVKVCENGSADLDLTTLPKGIIIIKSPYTQIKVNNK